MTTNGNSITYGYIILEIIISLIDIGKLLVIFIVLPSKEILDLLEMYCHSSVYMTVKWVLEDMPVTSEKLAKLMIEAMPNKLINLFNELNILRSM